MNAEATTEALNDATAVILKRLPHRFKPGHNLSPRKLNTSLTEIVEFADLIRETAFSKELPAVDLAALARAFCLLDERIRIRRGIPLPGQLRPDLPPMKGLKGKRARQAMLLEMAGGSGSKSFVEATPAAEEPAAEGSAVSEEQAPEGNAAESKKQGPPKPAPKRRVGASS